MTTPCPHCALPADMPTAVVKARRRMTAAERLMFDLMWQRSPGGATETEILERADFTGVTISVNSIPALMSRIRQHLGDSATVTNRYRPSPRNTDKTRVWVLNIDGFDRARGGL